MKNRVGYWMTVVAAATAGVLVLGGALGTGYAEEIKSPCDAVSNSLTAEQCFLTLHGADNEVYNAALPEVKGPWKGPGSDGEYNDDKDSVMARVEKMYEALVTKLTTGPNPRAILTNSYSPVFKVRKWNASEDWDYTENETDTSDLIYIPSTAGTRTNFYGENGRWRLVLQIKNDDQTDEEDTYRDVLGDQGKKKENGYKTAGLLATLIPDPYVGVVFVNPPTSAATVEKGDEVKLTVATNGLTGETKFILAGNGKTVGIHLESDTCTPNIDGVVTMTLIVDDTVSVGNSPRILTLQAVKNSEGEENETVGDAVEFRLTITEDKCKNIATTAMALGCFAQLAPNFEDLGFPSQFEMSAEKYNTAEAVMDSVSKFFKEKVKELTTGETPTVTIAPTYNGVADRIPVFSTREWYHTDEEKCDKTNESVTCAFYPATNGTENNTAGTAGGMGLVLQLDGQDVPGVNGTSNKYGQLVIIKAVEYKGVTSVTVVPATADVVKGGTQTFTATVTAAQNIATTVTWSVEGGTTGTSITNTSTNPAVTGGILTVDAVETATTLTVKATSTVDNTKVGTATVTVTTTPTTTQYTITYSVVGGDNGNGTLAATLSTANGTAVSSGSTVNTGSTVVFTAAPSSGYKVKEWKVGSDAPNGTSEVTSGTGNVTLTISSITANTTVTVEFEMEEETNPPPPPPTEMTLVTAASITGVTSPVSNAAPSTAINNGTGFTSSLSWDGSPATFAYSTQYTAIITLTAASGYTFKKDNEFGNTASIAGFRVNGNAPTEWVSNDGGNLVFKVKFPATGSSEITPSPSVITFLPLVVGYAQPPSAQIVTIANTGTAAVTLSQPVTASSSYDINTMEGYPAAGEAFATGKTASFTVRPLRNLSVGEYTATIEINYSDGKKTSVTVTFRVVAASTYEIEASAPVLNFGETYVKPYTQPKAQVVIVTNVGTSPVTLSQPASTASSSAYIIGPLSSTTLAAGAAATFNVRPKAGLAAGEDGDEKPYNEDIKIEGASVDGVNKTNTATITASFTVKPALKYAISVSPLSSFGYLPPDYDAADAPRAQVVTVRNEGTGEVRLNQPTAVNYTVGKLSSTTLEHEGDEATFTIQPKSNLKLGNHDEYIIISGGVGDAEVRDSVFAAFSVASEPIYVVRFDANGGTVAPGSASTGSGGRLTAPTPKRDDYVFDGWYVGSLGGAKVTAGTVFESDTVVVAKWTPAESHELTTRAVVTYSAGANGTLRATVDGVSLASGATVAAGKNVVFTAVPASGYGLVRWTVNGVVDEDNTASTYTIVGLSKSTTVAAAFDRVSVRAAEREIPAGGSSDVVGAVAPVAALSAGLTAGPNPAARSSGGSVSLYRDGSRVAYATLTVYDAGGNAVKKIRVIDDAVGSQRRRKVSAWNLRDSRGRVVSPGTYVIQGVLKASGGKRERVSVVVGVL